MVPDSIQEFQANGRGEAAGWKTCRNGFAGLVDASNATSSPAKEHGFAEPSHNIDIFGTVTVRAIVQYKWETFGLSLWLKEFCVYCTGLAFLVALSILDWQNWGLLPDDRNAVPPAVAKALGLPVFNFEHFILEGGSIDTNGQGTLLTTESCLLNANRNPALDRTAIEKKLRDKLGVTKILWLGDGIEGDDTDGHVDDITRFVGPSTVITAVEEDEHDPNFEPLQQNLDRLHTMRLADGEPLHVLTLPMPTRIMRDGQRLPASYANFYIANSVVLLPVFNEHNDSWAVSALHEAFPSRRIVPIDCRELIWGLGAFHCLTQQQPAAC
jgi:agmatine deiminase